MKKKLALRLESAEGKKLKFQMNFTLQMAMGTEDAEVTGTLQEQFWWFIAEQGYTLISGTLECDK